MFFCDKLYEAYPCGVLFHFLLLMCSFKSPAIIIWYPSLYHVEIDSEKSRSKECLGHSLLTVLLNNFKCCTYTGTVPPSWLVVTGLYNVAMLRVSFPWPLNICHDYLPSPVASLPEPILFPDRFPVVNDPAPTY